ncbi:MAG TPA: asparagine synthetase B, partial [Planctomycetaceae bacterium]|nr:asparagine synthetase B [Planctomycetaceae bacterium]
MCGIFGVTQSQVPIDLSLVVRMGRAVRHRGPDDEGYLFLSTGGERIECIGENTAPGCDGVPVAATRGRAIRTALGHRRLAILDPTSAGHRPMSSESGRFWITYNGEVYNFVELR